MIPAHAAPAQRESNRLTMRHPRDPTLRVTHETIYRWVYGRYEAGEHWHEQLRRRRKRRRRIPGQRKDGRGQTPGRVGIEERPAVVNFRGRFGDWEADTIEGAKGTGLVGTHVERKSRYTKLGKLADKRDQRKHQRPAPRLVPQRQRLPQGHRRPTCPSRADAQQSSPQVPQLPHPGRGPQRLTRRCASELNPPGSKGLRSIQSIAGICGIGGDS